MVHVEPLRIFIHGACRGRIQCRCKFYWVVAGPKRRAYPCTSHMPYFRQNKMNTAPSPAPHACLSSTCTRYPDANRNHHAAQKRHSGGMVHPCLHPGAWAQQCCINLLRINELQPHPNTYMHTPKYIFYGVVMSTSVHITTVLHYSHSNLSVHVRII